MNEEEKELPIDPLLVWDGPELVFGFVGPVGCNIDLVQKTLEDTIKQHKYTTINIRLSELICSLPKYSDFKKLKKEPEHDRISKLMDAGTELRRKTCRADILAQMAIAEIRRLRREGHRLNKKIQHNDLSEEDLSKNPLFRTAYIIRSLKTPEEVHLFRKVYGRAFFLISVYSPKEERIDRVSDRIRRTTTSFKKSDPQALATSLISRDENEQGTDGFGQNVIDAFPQADFFIDSRDSKLVREKITRFLEAVFDYPYHSPTKDEFGMYAARAVALRSSDMGRQVGAAITNPEGDVLAVGCNDVPKFGGGLYWTDDTQDKRDFQEREDMSVSHRKEMLANTISRLADAGLINEASNDKDPYQIAEQILFDKDSPESKAFRGASILNIIEHGRSVHAEMAALMSAAQRGVSVKGGTLYTTTFPCHLCARHIVAAGISRVVYIEPYPKSLAKNLYRDSIVVDSAKKSKDHVLFEPFAGIAPRLYEFVFEAKGSRKSLDGSILDWTPENSHPRIIRYVTSYIMMEDQVVGSALPSALSYGSYET